MKRKSGNIGLVVADGQLRAVQMVDGKVIASTVASDENFKKSVRQLLSSAPFVGKQVRVGLEGGSVLIESLIVPPGAKSPRAICNDRLKGDPVFNAEKATMGFAAESTGAASRATPGPSLVVMAAVDKQKLEDVVSVCRELQLDVEAVECGALSAWRAWPGEGLHVRLIRSGDDDMVLAGRDDKLLFARIVPSPFSGAELKATISRALGAIGGGHLEVLETVGVNEDERMAYADDIGIRVDVAPAACDDCIGLGLATDGRALVDFTPPEERVMRQKRKVRKYGVSMTAAAVLVVALAGVAGSRKADDLETKRSDLQNQLSILAAAKVELASLQEEMDKEEANERVINLAAPGHRMSTLFSIIANKAAGSIMIESINIADEEKAVLDPAAEVDPDAPVARILDVRLHGIAADNLAVRQFADDLLATQAFSNVQVEASERVLIGVGTEGERFRIYARAETR